jgi:hypothetical protein
MTEITVTCPHCREEARAPADAAGRNADCPSCGKSFTIPPVANNNPPPVRERVAPLPAPSAPHPASPIPLASAAVQMPVTSGMAIASMVLGILGLVGGWMCCGVVFPVLALVFGHLSLSQIQKSSGRLTGKNMAIAGLTMGYVGFLFGLVMSLVMGTFTVATSAAMEQLEKMLPPMK